MATQTDTLRTILSVVGGSQYTRTMQGSAAATGILNIATQRAAASEAARTVATQAAAAATVQRTISDVAAAQAAVVLVTAEVAVARAELAAATSAIATAEATIALAAAETTAAGAAVALAAAEGTATAGAIGLETALAPVMIVLTALALPIAAVAAGLIAIGAAAVVGGGSAAYGLKEVTLAAAEFEAIMKEVELQSGATAEAMEEIKFAALAPEMSRLGKSATDVATAYKRLAAEGYDLAAQKALMLPIIQAAIVLGGEEAEVTRLFLNIMQQYNLALTDASRITDTLANALANTSFQGDELSTVLGYVGSDAAAAGFSLEGTISITDQIIKRLGDASRTGTGFRMILASILGPSDKMRESFAKSSVSVEDLQVAMGDEVEIVRLLSRALQEGVNFYDAFEVRAASVATILARSSIPEMEKTNEAFLNAGFGAEFATEKMDTLEGALGGLDASWKNLRVAIGLATQDVSVGWVKGIGLALTAMTNFAADWNTAQGKMQDDTKAGGGVILDVANLTIIALAVMATAMVALAQQTAYAASITMRFAQAWLYVGGMWGYAARIGREAAELWKFASVDAVNYQKTIDKVTIDLMNRISDLRKEMLREIPAVPAITPEEAPAAVGMPTDTMRKSHLDYLENLVAYQFTLQTWYERAKTTTDDQLTQLALAVVYRQREVQVTSEIYRMAIALGLEEEKQTKAYQEQEKAITAQLEAEQRLRQENLKLQERAAKEAQKAIEEYQREQEKMFREAHRERMRAATDMERIAREGEKMQRAIQLVIGGRLREAAQQGLELLTGAGLGGRAAAMVRGGENRIIVDLQMSGLTDEGRRQITNHLTEVVKEGIATIPAMAY